MPRRATPTIPPGLNIGVGGGGAERVGTPKLPPGLEGVRSATPKLPPGLFTAAGMGIEQNELGEEKRIEQIDGEGEEKGEKGEKGKEKVALTSMVPTTSDAKSDTNLTREKTQRMDARQEKPAETRLVEGARESQDVARADADVNADVEVAAASKAVERDPTPAESMASRKKGARQASVKVGKGKSAAMPGTPAKVVAKPKEVASVATPPEPTTRASPEKKVDAPVSASKRPHPGKLNLDTTPEVMKEEKKDTESPALPSASSKIDLQRTSRAPSLSATSLSSRPGTPLATAVATGSPLKRAVQPRTLRITAETPKAETPPPIPTSTAAASTPPLPALPNLPSLPAKIASRRTSIASLNAPGTPATERADTLSITSGLVSRANSPPPLGSGPSVGSVVGKKSRKKDKVKKEKEAAVEAIMQSKEEVREEIAPIMARKVKKKGAGGGGGGKVVRQLAPDTVKVKKETPEYVLEERYPQPKSEVKVESPSKGKAKSASPPVQVPATPPPKEEVKVVPEKEKTPPPPPPPPADELTAAAILQALDSTHQLALSTLNLLKPLTSQHELKKMGMDPFTSADLQNHIEQLRYELSKADEQLLKQGSAVRKDLGSPFQASKNRVSGRLLVTPIGRRLSCLTREEEDRYLELEKRRYSEKGYSRWGGGDVTSIPWQTTKIQKGKLQSMMGQEDILRALSVATESLEGALRDATNRPPAPARNDQNVNAHLAGHTLPPPNATLSRTNSSEPHTDARSFVNKFVECAGDTTPPLESFPSPNPMDDLQASHVNPGWTTTTIDVDATFGFDEERYNKLRATRDAMFDGIDLDAHPEVKAMLAAPREPLTLNIPTQLPLPSMNMNTHMNMGMNMSTEAGTAAAMDTLKEAMATAGAIAKLGASEALKNPKEILKQWDKAVAGSGMPKHLQSAMEKVIRDVGVGSSSSGGSGSGKKSGGGGPMSMAELEREGLRERVVEARREAVEWEKRLNKVVRGNRKAVLGSH